MNRPLLRLQMFGDVRATGFPVVRCIDRHDGVLCECIRTVRQREYTLRAWFRQKRP